MSLTRHLFIVGAQKCGTSSLASAICQAFNDIELSAPKEPMVFSRGDFECHRTRFKDFEVPFFQSVTEMRDEYDACFAGDRVRLDASTSYMISPLACTTINRIFPDARIVVVLRDPVERMVSAYWHYLRSGLVCHDFDRAIELGPLHLVECGFYRRHVDSLVSIFGRERLLVLSDRHLYADPEGFLQRFEVFTGLSHSNKFTLGRDNAGAYPLMLRSQQLANYLRQRSNKNFFHRSVTSNRLKTYGLVGGVAEAFSRLNIRRAMRPKIRTELLVRLVDLYRRENQGIDDLLDMGDTGHWYQDYSTYFDGASN
jgi:hypothetical protein